MRHNKRIEHKDSQPDAVVEVESSETVPVEQTPVKEADVIEIQDERPMSEHKAVFRFIYNNGLIIDNDDLQANEVEHAKHSERDTEMYLESATLSQGEVVDFKSKAEHDGVCENLSDMVAPSDQALSQEIELTYDLLLQMIGLELESHDNDMKDEALRSRAEQLAMVEHEIECRQTAEQPDSVQTTVEIHLKLMMLFILVF